MTFVVILKPRQDIEERRLAGAVGSNQAHDLAFLDIEADAVAGHHTAESHDDVFAAKVAGHQCCPYEVVAAREDGATGSRGRMPAAMSWRRLIARNGRARTSPRPAGANMSTAISATPLRMKEKSASVSKKYGKRATNAPPRMGPISIAEPPTTAATRISTEYQMSE